MYGHPMEPGGRRRRLRLCRRRSAAAAKEMITRVSVMGGEDEEGKKIEWCMV